MSRERRIAAERRGRVAEAVAALLLMAKGYRIVDRRFRSPVGEIDLVAQRRRRLCFVEVKVRGTAADAAFGLTPRQQQRIMRAAELWLARHPAFAGHDLGFDVVLVAPRALPRHLIDAFPL